MPTATPAHFDVDVSFGSPSFALVAKPAKFDVDVSFGAPAAKRVISPLHFNVDVGFRPIAVYSVSADRPFVFLINGVDRSTSVLQSDEVANISHKLGAISTAEIVTCSETGSYRPTRGQDLVIIESSTNTRLFGGFLQVTEEYCPPGTEAVFVRCSAVGYGARFDKRYVGAHIPAGQPIIFTPGTMALELIREYVTGTGLSYGSDAGSAIYEDFLFQWVPGLQALRQIADHDGLDTWIDEYGRIYFVNRSTGYGSAPFNIADNDGNVDAEGGGPRVRRDGSRYANKVLVRPDLREPGMWRDSYTGDEALGGIFFPTKYILDDKPVVTVDGTVKTVGEYASSAGSFDFTYVPGGYGVYASATYTSGNEIIISYPSPLQPVYIAQDDAEIASHGSIAEALIDVKDVTDPALLQAIADAWLTRLKVEPYIVSYQTMRTGLRPGQLQTINLTRPLVPNLSMTIDSVSGTFQPTVSGGFFRWQITASNAQVQGEGDFTRTMQRIAAGLAQPQDRTRTTIVVGLALTVQGVTNPGLTAMTVPGYREIDKPGFVKEVRVHFHTAPASTTVQINVLKNGSTIFANSTYIEFAPGDSGTTVVKRDFTSQPLAVADGDKITVVIVTADSAAKDGTLEIEIQG